MAKQMAFYYNANACVACRTCQIACKDRSNLPTGVNWRRVYQYEQGSWVPDPADSTRLIPSGVAITPLSIACMHCQNPKCVEICPTQAMYKSTDGVVLIDQNKCIGCRYCEWACPYGAPQFDESKGVMTKCDFCQDLTAAGQNPVCVDACVMRVLDYGDLEELRAKYGGMAEMEPLPAASITSPSFVMTPHRNGQMAGQGRGKILALPEEA